MKLRRNTALRSLSSRSRKARLAGIVILACAAALVSRPAAPVRAAGADPALRDFVGVNHVVGGNRPQQLGIGWARIEVSWRGVESQQGTMNWGSLDKDVQEGEATGTQVLPMLGYTPPWAGTSNSPAAPPKNIQDWANFVEQAVSRYSAAPYNLQYFQIWNEPTKAAGFWLGTDQQYIDTVYIPAAKVIHQHGCKVVFGGWPQSNSVQELDNVLNYHNAWQYTDIIDVHYHSLPDFKHLYTNWVASGRCHGVWQTEVGWSAAGGLISGMFSRYLYWALQTGWSDPNEFKLFWYVAEASGADEGKGLLAPGGQSLTQQGAFLAGMNQALGGGALSTFTQFNTNPPVTGPAGDGWALGYQVGGKIVIQFLLDRAFVRAHPSATVSVNAPGTPSQVYLLSGQGKRSQAPGPHGSSRVQVTVPFGSFDDCPTCQSVQGYLIIE